MISILKLFATLYLISFGLILALNKKTGNPIVLPGDIYINKAQRKIYLPIGSSLNLSLVLAFILYKVYGKKIP